MGACGRDGEDRVFVDHPWRPLRRDLRAFELSGPDAEVGDRFAALVALIEEGDVRAHLAQAVEKPGPRRVYADAFDRQVRSRDNQRRDKRERRRGRITRHGDRRRGEFAETLYASSPPAAILGLARDRGAEVPQHALGVVARRLGLDDRGGPRGVETGEQYRRFDLGRGHRKTIADRYGVRCTFDGERQPSGFTGDEARTDAAQRLDDAAHRPPPQRRVAGNEGGDRVSGEDPEEKARRGSRIAEIEQVFRLGEGTDPDTVDGPSTAPLILGGGSHGRAKRAQRSSGREHVLALEQARNFGPADSERTQHQCAVRDRFISGDANLAGEWVYGQGSGQWRRRLGGDGLGHG